jgi:hypothetical protein
MGSALPGLGLPSKADVYAAALEGLVQVNGCVFDRCPDLPPIYQSGARFKAIPHDTWRRADTIAIEGWGDCEGLASWRTAELRRTGEDPNARVGCYHTGPNKYHAIVVRGNDDIEDPSVNLGMRPRATMPLTREQMNAINGMWPRRMRTSVDVVDCVGSGSEWDLGIDTSFVENPDGSVAAQIKIPTGDGNAIVATTPPIKYAGLLSKPGDFLERPENIAQLEKMGPQGKIAAAIIKNPWAREARQVTHSVLRQIPGLGRLF